MQNNKNYTQLRKLILWFGPPFNFIICMVLLCSSSFTFFLLLLQIRMFSRCYHFIHNFYLFNFFLLSFISSINSVDSQIFGLHALCRRSIYFYILFSLFRLLVFRSEVRPIYCLFIEIRSQLNCISVFLSSISLFHIRQNTKKRKTKLKNEIGSAIKCFECNSHYNQGCEQDKVPSNFTVDCSLKQDRDDRNKPIQYTLCRKVLQVIEFSVNQCK